MKKWHKDCGGRVDYKEGRDDDHFLKAGLCSKCDAFPLDQEETIFEISEKQIEYYNNTDLKWIIMYKNELSERLE